jgi:glycosyltransferase involved in cell wall biosynthesis
VSEDLRNSPFFGIWCQTVGFGALHSTFDYRVIGNCEGFSQDVKCIEELIYAYHMAGVYLNVDMAVAYPNSILEAMACGCPVVSVNNDSVKGFIQNGRNGFICENIVDLQKCCVSLLNDKELAYNIGIAGRNTVIKNNEVKSGFDNIFEGIRKNEITFGS